MKIAHHTNLVLVLLTALLFAECKKDETSNVTEQPFDNPLPFHKIDSVLTLITPSDLRYFEFDYAGNEVIASSNYGGIHYSFENIGSIKKQYVYDGSNDLIDSAIYFLNNKGYPDSSYWFDLFQQMTDTSYYSFDSDGHLIYYKNTSGIGYQNHRFYFIYQNSNLIKYVSIGNGNDTFEIHYSYDPVLLNTTNFELFPYVGNLSMFGTPSKNLVNKYHTFYNGTEYAFEVSNLFNAENYLIQSLIIDSLTNDTIQIRTYTY